jgi:hypothetical protein
MNAKPLTLSNTARAMLMLAAAREDRLVPPPRLPPAAARQVVRSLIGKGLIEEVTAISNESALFWRTSEEGIRLHLRATSAGIVAAMEGAGDGGFEAAVAPAPPRPDPDIVPDAARPPEVAHEARQGAIVPNPHLGLRQAAQAVLVAWQKANGVVLADTLHQALQDLHRTLSRAPSQRPPDRPREGTKQAQVIALLRRPEGTTVAQIAEAMNWAPHTVRGFFAGLKKKGMNLEVLERVRQVGPNKVGAKGTAIAYEIATV